MYWEQIFSLISPDDVRRLRNERRGNLKILFTQAVGMICQVTPNHTTPHNMPESNEEAWQTRQAPPRCHTHAAHIVHSELPALFVSCRW